MALYKAMEKLKFDARLIEINLKHGHITKDELQKHLNSLPDLAANAEQLDVEERRRQGNSSDNH